MGETVVVGAGIAGYSLAVILARAGWRVRVFEKNLVGGECTNYGCAPAKALLHYAELYEEALENGFTGKVEPLELLHRGLREAARIAGEERDGVKTLLERAGVELVEAKAVVKTGGAGVRVQGGGVEYSPDTLVVATGSDPLIPSWVEECPRVADNRRFFAGSWRVDGERIAIIGGGFVGVEVAQSLARLGFSITIYEAMSQLLPGFDKDLALVAKRLLVGLGVEVKTSTPVSRVKCSGDLVEVCSGDTCRGFDAALIALGRKPCLEGVESLPRNPKGFIDVDESRLVKGFKNIYAVGDVTGPPLLAHKAVADSLRVARRLLGSEAPEPKTVPMVVYGKPELVQVEHPELKSYEGRLRALRLPWGYNMVVRIRRVKAQLVTAKILYDNATGRILAVYMAGPNVSELAGYATYIVEKGVRVEELRSVIHPHPSASESLWEAVLQAFGENYNRV